MSDLSFIDLVAAWEMLVDQHLSSSDWVVESRYLFQSRLEESVFRDLLLAMVKPPSGTSQVVADKLRSRNLEEVEAAGQKDRALPRKQFMELLALANGKSIELGRELPGFIARLASRTEADSEVPESGARISRPTLPVPTPDEALLERCRYSEPPTIMPPPAYPAAFGLEDEMVPSKRRLPSEPPEIAVGAEEVDIDDLEDEP